jgi:hypothetical protein
LILYDIDGIPVLVIVDGQMLLLKGKNYWLFALEEGEASNVNGAPYYLRMCQLLSEGLDMTYLFQFVLPSPPKEETTYERNKHHSNQDCRKPWAQILP